MDIKKYLNQLGELTLEQSAQLENVKLLIENMSSNNKVILLGNGGSASIASHVATDLTNAAKIRAIDFSESSLITCLSNDYGYENWMTTALAMYAKEGDILILISSSGNSENIIKAGKYWQGKGPIIAFSGFDYDNRLNNLDTTYKFWVDSKIYNHTEMVHHIWLVALVDMLSGIIS